MYIYSYNDNKKKDGRKVFYTAVLAILITVLVVENIIILLGNERENYAATRLSSNNSYSYDNTNYSSTNDIPNVIEAVKKATVGISLLQPDNQSIFDINATQKWGLGTGIIVSEKGYILTNQHLAQNVGARIVVTLHDGKSIQGTVIWAEENIDVAIIRVNERNLDVATLGDSEYIQIGEDVIAIGNPLGVEFQGTTTKGIISGLNRTFLFEEDGEKVFMEGLIQTDASINPGNSGGPLVNKSGEIIGINTVKITDAEGIGFAVPINIVKPIIEKLEDEGEFKEGYLGIYAYDKEVIKYIDSNLDIESGIYVATVSKGGPSEKAGIKEGDIITQIDNREINKMTELREYIYSKDVGDTVMLKIRRGQEELDIGVKLIAK